MKRTIIAALLATTAGAAFADGVFDYQRQIGSEEYVAGYDVAGLEFAPVAKSGERSSLERIIVEADVDGIALNDFDGEIVESGPTRISLYEVYRGSPEGVAYADYHERFPAQTVGDLFGFGNVASTEAASDSDS